MERDIQSLAESKKYFLKKLELFHCFAFDRIKASLLLLATIPLLFEHVAINLCLSIILQFK
jgi:hypothetical protein